jgi:quinol monooxygenase YgiN
MDTDIALVLEVAVKPDALDEFGALIREAVAEDEAAEPGSRILECFTDGQVAHFYERYQDSAAALTHLQRFGENYASRFMALCTPGRLNVYGEPSDEVKAALAAFSPRYLQPLAGFARSKAWFIYRGYRRRRE